MSACLIRYSKNTLNLVDLCIILNADFAEFVIGVRHYSIIFSFMKSAAGIIFWLVGICFLGSWARGVGGELSVSSWCWGGELRVDVSIT